MIPGTGSGVQLEFRVLGSLQMARGGELVSIGSTKQRILLAALLVNVNEVVSAEWLCDVAWSAKPPVEPRKALHTHLARLRTRLEHVGGAPGRELIATRPPGYVMVIDPDRLDAGRFEQLVGSAQRAADARLALELLDEGLGLWRGVALGEFDQEFARVEARRLEELRLVAREERIEALMDLGRETEAIADLERLVANDPFRERPRHQLMRALYRCGRQADALAGYRAFRDNLAAELGLEPSPQLRTLERDILQQAEHLAARTAQPEPPAAAAMDPAARQSLIAPVRGSLPEELTSFVGRERDTVELPGTLRRARLLTLTGVGGVGKTRLAVRLARQQASHYGDGAAFCDLTPVADGQAVGHTIAAALGVRPQPGLTAEDGIVNLLRSQNFLLVLDNCEHVVAAVAAMVARILQGCPRVTVLATSRRPLALDGEHLWPVEPLEVGSQHLGRTERLPAAVELFYDRASALLPDFTPSAANIAAVTEICRRLDGLPLAIELAAARLPSLAPADIAARLEDRFRLLTTGRRAATDRHRTLRAVVDWSYDLLDPTPRSLFDRLSVFAGSFTLRSAEQVCSSQELASPEVADLLAELVEHSLLVADHQGAQVRYRQLETLRQYGRQRLAEGGESLRWQRRHAAHFLELAEEAASGLRGPSEVQWVRVLDQEHDDVREVVRFAATHDDLDTLLRVAVSLCDYAIYGLRVEVFGWIHQALEATGATAHPLYSPLCGVAAMGCVIRGEWDRAEQHIERALHSAPDPGDPSRLFALAARGALALNRGQLQELGRVETESLPIARAVGDTHHQLVLQVWLALAHLRAGEQGEALRCAERQRELAEVLGSPTGISWHRYVTGEILRTTDPVRAARCFEEATRLADSVGNRLVSGVARAARASAEASQDDPYRALPSFQQAISHWHDGADWVHQWTTLSNLVTLLARLGADAPAAVLRGAVLGAATAAPASGADIDNMAAMGSSLQADLGAEAFTTLDARGRTMSDDDAVGYALAQIERLLHAPA